MGTWPGRVGASISAVIIVESLEERADRSGGERERDADPGRALSLSLSLELPDCARLLSCRFRQGPPQATRPVIMQPPYIWISRWSPRPGTRDQSQKGRTRQSFAASSLHPSHLARIVSVIHRINLQLSLSLLLSCCFVRLYPAIAQRSSRRRQAVPHAQGGGCHVGSRAGAPR